MDEKSAHEIENDFYETKKLDESEDKNYLIGFFGSLIFSLGGVLAYVIIGVFFNYILLGLFSIGVSCLGIMGYFYFKGIRGRL